MGEVAGAVKRTTDLVGSVLAMVVLAPIGVAVALAVVLESGRPVFFRQTRVGRDGVEFEMLKFRSMVTEAPDVGPYYTAADDPRITRVGRFVRRTSLDELPQLLNVLRGDMSLVGPRPDVPDQRELYDPDDWRQRCTVRPGITGLSQALYRSDSSEAQRLEADLTYTREASPWLDLRIMWWTLRRISGRGAN